MFILSTDQIINNDLWLFGAVSTDSSPAWMIIFILLLTVISMSSMIAVNLQIRKKREYQRELISLKNHAEELKIMLDCIADFGKINYFSGVFNTAQLPITSENTPVIKFTVARSSCISPEMQTEYLQKYRSFFSGENTGFSFKYSMQLNGQIKQFCDYAKLISLPDTGVEKFIISTMDISELAKQTRELANADTILQAIFDNLPGHIFIKNMSSDFTYLRCNNSFSSLVQMHPEEVAGKNDFDLFDHELAKLIRTCDMQVAATHTMIDNRWFFKTPDGKEHATRFISRPLKRPDGSEIIIGFGIDVTHQERVAGKLRKRNKELRLLLAQMNDAVMLLDTDLLLSCASPAMQELYPEHLKNSESRKYCSDICLCNITDPSLCPAVRARNTGTAQICQYAGLNGRILNIKPLLNENSAVAYLAVTAAADNSVSDQEEKKYD